MLLLSQIQNKEGVDYEVIWQENHGLALSAAAVLAIGTGSAFAAKAREESSAEAQQKLSGQCCLISEEEYAALAGEMMLVDQCEAGGFFTWSKEGNYAQIHEDKVKTSYAKYSGQTYPIPAFKSLQYGSK